MPSGCDDGRRAFVQGALDHDIILPCIATAHRLQKDTTSEAAERNGYPATNTMHSGIIKRAFHNDSKLTLPVSFVLRSTFSHGVNPLHLLEL